VSKDELLLQSSTVSSMVEAEFNEGISRRSGVLNEERGERKVLPEFKNINGKQIQRKHRRDGFETGNADKIFEST
jgi:hypothetical protein